MKKKLIIFIFIFCSKIIVAQCAMCKAVVESGDQKMAEAVNNGITYLMVFPYVLVGILAYLLIRHKRKIKN